MCVTKLARIDHPEAKLCRAVLINNTLRKCQRQSVYLQDEEEEREEKIDKKATEGEEDENSEKSEVDRVGTCQDVINHFLGLIDSPQAGQIEDNEEEREENTLTGGHSARNSSCLSEFVSPYSYSSFLSEVYRESINRILRKVNK